MYTRIVWVAVLATLFVSAAPAPAPVSAGAYVKCADESPNIEYQNSMDRHCRKVMRLIRQRFPDGVEDHAISCASGESGLDKWARFQEPSQYKGIVQVSKNLRRVHNWAWRLKVQVRVYYNIWKQEGFDPWYAYGC